MGRRGNHSPNRLLKKAHLPGTHPLDGCPPPVGTPALARRCDVRTEYASHRVPILMGAAALPFDRLTVPSDVEGHLDLFEQPGQEKIS